MAPKLSNYSTETWHRFSESEGRQGYVRGQTRPAPQSAFNISVASLQRFKHMVSEQATKIRCQKNVVVLHSRRKEHTTQLILTNV